MPEPDQLDKTFDLIMRTMVERGYAPHFSEIGAEFGMMPDDGQNLLREVMETGAMPMWLHPGTDLIASFAPFHNLPNQYRITIEGQTKWFAQ